MAFQRTDRTSEQFASYSQGSKRLQDANMMDEILALLLQDHSSSSDEESKEHHYSGRDGVTTTKAKAKDCEVPGQHCGSEQDERYSPKMTKASLPPLLLAFSANPGVGGDGGRLDHSMSDIRSLMSCQTSSSVRMDFASIFRDKPPDRRSGAESLGSGPVSKQSAPTRDLPEDGRSAKKSIVELNDAEFEQLKKRMRTQEASRRYRRRKKETLRQQKQEIQELRDELARLHSIETDIQAMDQQSPSAVVRDFDAYAQELQEILDKTRAAAESELGLVRSIQDRLPGKSPATV